jgi:Tfp pilus assembly protein PilV
MTLFELTVALFIVSTALVAIVQLVAMTASQRRTLDQRRIAELEVANQAERMALLPWEQASPEKLTTWEPSANLMTALPQAKCAVAVAEEAGPPVARRIRLKVTWTNPAGQEMQPAALTMWKFAAREQP